MTTTDVVGSRSHVGAMVIVVRGSRPRHQVHVFTSARLCRINAIVWVVLDKFKQGLCRRRRPYSTSSLKNFLVWYGRAWIDTYDFDMHRSEQASSFRRLLLSAEA